MLLFDLWTQPALGPVARLNKTLRPKVFTLLASQFSGVFVHFFVPKAENSICETISIINSVS